MLRTLRLLIVLLFAPVLSVPGALAAQIATPAATPLASAANPDPLPANMDRAADPRRDFYRFATGGWQERATIPPDKAGYSVSQEVDDRTTKQLLGILERLSTANDLPVGSDEWKAVQLFAQGMDRATREAQGITPIQDDLDKIDAISNTDELYAWLRDAPLGTNAWGLYGVGASPDLADSSVYAAWYSGPDLGLPNRDYYWDDTPENQKIREAYRATMAKLLGFIGYDEAQATDAANRVYALEKRLAEPLLPPEAGTDPTNFYNPRPVADLIAANPDFDWPAFLKIMGIPDVQTVIVTQLAYLNAVDGIVKSTDLATLKDHFKLQVLWNTASALTQEMDDTVFAFGATTLAGVEQQLPDDEQALGAVNGNLGFALGKLYVDEYFPPEAKAQIEDLVKGLTTATRGRIEQLDWMTPQTKEAALAKLAAMNVKVGYPDTWQTYEKVEIGDSYAQSILNAGIAEYERQLARVGKPVDRDEWGMLPQEVNAYYSPTNNEIVFPAAILQAPFFDPDADPAVNYGGIGATIGHEITHAFDQSGSQFDAQGNLANWWTPEDTARFEALTARVARQYSGIEVMPGLAVNGELTIGENIADMGGLQIAHDALRTELATSGDPGLIDGLTQEQRFFVAYALSWADKLRSEALRTLVQTNEHAPAQVRAVQPARNMDAFFAAFGIEPGDPMYMPPNDRVVIW